MRRGINLAKLAVGSAMSMLAASLIVKVDLVAKVDPVLKTTPIFNGLHYDLKIKDIDQLQLFMETITNHDPSIAQISKEVVKDIAPLLGKIPDLSKFKREIPFDNPYMPMSDAYHYGRIKTKPVDTFSKGVTSEDKTTSHEKEGRSPHLR